MTGLRFTSIASRLITLHVIAIVVVTICLPLVLLFLLSQAATDLQERALQQQAEELARHLRRDATGGWTLDLPPPLQAQYARDAHGYARYGYALVDENGKALQSSLEDVGPIGDVGTLQADPVFFQRDWAAVRLAGISLPVPAEGAKVWIQASQDLAHRDALIDDIVAGFLHKVGWVTVPILAVLLAVDLFIFSQALKPLMQASEMAMQIGPTSTDIRLPTEGVPRELRPLIRAVNQALDRLERGFRAQREFTADAAHELRTPIAILRAHVDMMSDKQVATTLRHDIETMQHLIDQMLDFAEIDTLIVAPEERAELGAVCGEVAAFLAPLALEQGREIAVIGAETAVWVRGNADALFHAIRNLAENALRHTKPGTAVELTVTPEGVVRVQDEGPGVPEGERALIFRRFWRRDRRANGGAGLGLSIVARIAEAHGGQVGVDNRPKGGAVFTLDLSAPHREALGVA